METISATQKNNTKLPEQPSIPSSLPETSDKTETTPTQQQTLAAIATASLPDTATPSQDSANESSMYQNPISQPAEAPPEHPAIDNQQTETTLSPSVSSEPIDTVNVVKKTGAEPLFTVHFKFDSSKLKALSSQVTSDLLNAAKSCSKQIKLTGHTCNLGPDFGNSFLGMNRAKAVKKLLISLGIEPSRIVTTSEGMNQPAAPNDTTEGQALNRRTELTCLDY